MITELIFSAVAAVSVLLAVAGATQLRQRAGINQRLNLSLGGPGRPLRLYDEEMSRPFSERVLLPLMQRISARLVRFWPDRRLRMIRTRLLLAGSPGGLRAIDFVLIRLFVAGAFLALGGLYLYLSPAGVTLTAASVALFFGLCGFYMPNVWLSGRIKRRQQAILRSLPDAIDMLTITTEAGLSFESGLQEIMTKWDNELSREFGRTLRDIGMGSSRRNALSELAVRCGIPDVQSFVTALNQAEEMGVSIGRVLRTQSEDLRVRRRQRAYELANQAPVKIMFPLVFLIFPSIFAVLLGPAIPQLLALGA
jgi:tight adherence protein C